jgi:ADP-ribose pyrophosphatase
LGCIIMERKVVYTTPWFDLVAKSKDGDALPHYSIQTKDYVSVVAVTTGGRLLLVRQYRAAVEAETLELPCGHVEPGETPEEAARKELLEETGYVANQFELLGDFSPDTGRLSNRLWCFFAGDATPVEGKAVEIEAGVTPVVYEGSLPELLAERDFQSALHSAALLLAVLRGRLSHRPGSLTNRG